MAQKSIISINYAITPVQRTRRQVKFTGSPVKITGSQGQKALKPVILTLFWSILRQRKAFWAFLHSSSSASLLSWIETLFSIFLSITSCSPAMNFGLTFRTKISPSRLPLRRALASRSSCFFVGSALSGLFLWFFSYSWLFSFLSRFSGATSVASR
jgi:hypothetical protein